MDTKQNSPKYEVTDLARRMVESKREGWLLHLLLRQIDKRAEKL